MNEASPIFLIDELIAHPGQGRALLAAYRERYVPGAIARGLTLQHELVAPPVWLHDQSNILMFLWRIEGGAQGWWSARIASGRDLEVEAWWRDATELIESRTRRFLAAAAAIERLIDV
jgi:hypothetical protein